MFKRSTRLLFLALSVFWAGVIFFLSSKSSLHTPALFPGQDKLFHLIAFGILAFLSLGAMRPAASGYRSRQIWFTVVLVTLYGILDEFHQYYVPGRSVEFYDALADACGSLLGACAMYYLARILASRSPPLPPIQ
jgi:VanZ family protein